MKKDFQVAMGAQLSLRIQTISSTGLSGCRIIFPPASLSSLTVGTEEVHNWNYPSQWDLEGRHGETARNKGVECIG